MLHVIILSKPLCEPIFLSGSSDFFGYIKVVKMVDDFLLPVMMTSYIIAGHTHFWPKCQQGKDLTGQ